jgi:hypothetical protein
MVNKKVKVEKGSHLTVTTYLDGSTKLEWDDEALLRDVRVAMAKAELEKKKPSVRAKALNRINKGK